jgi:hypothetical protein
MDSLQQDSATVKLSHYRPLGLQEVEAPRISTQSEHEGGKVVSPTHWQPLPLQRRSLVLIPVRGRVNPRPIVQLQGLSQ